MKAIVHKTAAWLLLLRFPGAVKPFCFSHRLGRSLLGERFMA